MQTSTRPKQKPALKNDVCDDIRLARFKPAIGSNGSRESKGKVMTCRSRIMCQDGSVEVFIAWFYRKAQLGAGNPPKHQPARRLKVQEL